MGDVEEVGDDRPSVVVPSVKQDGSQLNRLRAKRDQLAAKDTKLIKARGFEDAVRFKCRALGESEWNRYKKKLEKAKGSQELVVSADLLAAAVIEIQTMNEDFEYEPLLIAGDPAVFNQALAESMGMGEKVDSARKTVIGFWPPNDRRNQCVSTTAAEYLQWLTGLIDGDDDEPRGAVEVPGES